MALEEEDGEEERGERVVGGPLSVVREVRAPTMNVEPKRDSLSGAAKFALPGKSRRARRSRPTLIHFQVLGEAGILVEAFFRALAALGGVARLALLAHGSDGCQQAC